MQYGGIANVSTSYSSVMEKLEPDETGNLLKIKYLISLTIKIRININGI
jgi:hypothetical protein